MCWYPPLLIILIISYKHFDSDVVSLCFYMYESVFFYRLTLKRGWPLPFGGPFPPSFHYRKIIKKLKKWLNLMIYHISSLKHSMMNLKTIFMTGHPASSAFLLTDWIAVCYVSTTWVRHTGARDTCFFNFHASWKWISRAWKCWNSPAWGGTL